MPIPSRFLAAGNSPLSTITSNGDGATGLVATGSSQTDALQLSAVMNALTTSSASTGFKLQPCEAGAVVYVYNGTGQTTVRAYSFEGASVTINGTSGATGVVSTSAKGVLYFATSATTWNTIQGA